MFVADIGAGPSYHDVTCHCQQSLPITPSRDLRPGVSTHNKKQLGRITKTRLKMRDRIHCVMPIRSIKLKRGYKNLRVVLTCQHEHCITMKWRCHCACQLVRSDLSRNKKYFVDFK